MSDCRCCGRPKATDEDRKRYQDGEGAHLCWEPDDLRCEDGDPLDPYAEIDALRKRVAELEVENARIRADRDDARRLWCQAKAATCVEYEWHDASCEHQHAEERGWGYLYSGDDKGT